MNGFSGKRILIVEDNSFNAKVTAAYLNNYGYHTQLVATGEEAVAKIRGGQRPDLILMDIELGEGMDGAQTALTIQQYSDVPIVFLTAHTERSIMEKIRSLTAYGAVVKGSGEHVLISAVEIALRLCEANSQAKMYQQIYEDSLHEIYLFDPESLTFLTVNRGARENLGYTSEELSTMTPLDIEPELNGQSFRKLLEPLLRGEQEQILFNTVHRRKDGSLYPVEVNVQLFEYEREKVYVALINDLTERDKMVNELKEKEATLNTIVSTARDAIVMMDEKGNVTFWNQAAERLFGYTREEILREPFRLLVSDEKLIETVRQIYRHILLTGEGRAVGKTIEVKGKRKDGQELDVELSISAIKLNDAWHAVGIIRDISERKQSEEELANSRKQYLELAENAPIGILKCDQAGNIIYVNPKTLEILGSPSSEETKKINLLTFPLLVKYGLSEKLKECMQKNEPSTYEMNYETRWGKKVWLRIHIKPQVDKNTVIGAQIIIDDITERKQLEEENRRKDKQFRSMLEALPNPSYLIAKDRRILALNKAAKELGAAEGDYCWQSIHSLRTISAAEREAFETTGKPLPGTKCYFCLADEAMASEQKENCEVTLDCIVWDTWWVPVDEDKYLHYIVDVTKYKKMEEELRQRKEFLELLLSSMPAGVIVIDAKTHRIENVNMEAAAMIGAAPEEIIGKTCFEFFPHCKGCCPVINLGQDVNRAERILHRADGAEIPVLKTVKKIQTDSEEKLIETFVDLTERKKMEEQLYMLSITDPLTNAYNRRYFVQMLELEIERARRTGLPFSLIMADLDHFKSINDRFGHAAGDLALKSLVSLIQKRIRKTDILARWGGEEFILLLPDTPREGAVDLAEEMRRQLMNLDIPGVGRVTVSFGVAGFCDSDTADSIVIRADNLLYEAKSQGRNCVRYSGKCI